MLPAEWDKARVVILLLASALMSAVPGVLLGGCTGASRRLTGVVQPTRAGGRGWRRIRTDHFDVTTDLSPAEALDAALALERTRGALIQVGWSRLGTTRTTGREQVLVLENEMDFCHYFGGGINGVYVSSGSGSDRMVLWGSPPRWEWRQQVTLPYTNSVLRHEMVHHLAAGLYRRQPRWFSEGLAQFLETTRLLDTRTAQFGEPNPEAFLSYRMVRSVTVEDALAWDAAGAKGGEARTAGLYGLSWAMVHWMYFTQRAAFDRYQQALGRGDEPAAAWAASFAGWTPEAMGRAVHHYLQHGNYEVLPVELDPIEVNPSFVPLTAADVHALRAELAFVGSRMDERHKDLVAEARAELEETLSLEPGHVAGLRLAGLLLEPKITASEIVSRLREQVRRRPEDGEAWLALGRAPGVSEEQEGALRKAVAYLTGEARAYNALAWYLIGAHRGQEALPFATKAALLAPWMPAVLDTYAASLSAVGRCPDALRVELGAVDNLSERARGGRGYRPYLEALARYQTACGQATHAP